MKLLNYALLLAALGFSQIAAAQSGLSVTAAIGGSKSSAFGSLGAMAGLGIGTQNRLVLGGGIRTTLAHTADRDLDAIKPDNDAANLTIRTSKFNSLNGALFVWATYEVFRHVQVGANFDVIGGTTGKQINATINNGNGDLVQVTPVSASVLMLNNKDMGLLQSEFYVGYEFMPKAWVRAGFTHQHLEVRATTKPSGQERFGGFVNALFVGVSLPLGQAAPVTGQ